MTGQGSGSILISRYQDGVISKDVRIGMKKFTVRFDEELYQDLRAVSLAEGRPMVEIIRECIRDYTQKKPSIEEIKDLFARARSMGSVSEKEALERARDVAAADDEEGFGDLHHGRSRLQGDSDA